MDNGSLSAVDEDNDMPLSDAEGENSLSSCEDYGPTSNEISEGSSLEEQTSKDPEAPVFSGDFEELSHRIENSLPEETLVLDKDYKFENTSGGFSSKGIIISKSIVIDGNGHNINANKLSRVFNITADNVVLKNINFLNGNALGRYDSIDAGGGAIYWYGACGKVLNCNFTNNTGYGIEDDPFEKEELITTEDGMEIHTYIARPMGAKINEGGAIVWRGKNGLVSSCIFDDNDVGYPNSGGAICWRGDDGQISNSTFFKNGAWCGGAVCWAGNNGKILSSNFFDNGFFNGDIFWFGDNGLIRNSILIKNHENMSVLCDYGKGMVADYNFWGDSYSNPNRTVKINNLSNWYILNRNLTNPFLFKGNKLLVGFDDFLLVNKYGNVYNDSKKIDKLNLDPRVKIVSKNLIKYYMDSKQFKVKVFEPYGKLAINRYVTFKINKKSIKVRTDKKGIARLKINQKPGKYTVLVHYGDLKIKKAITVRNVLFTKNMSKKVGKTKYFRIKLLNAKGKAYPKQVLKVKFKSKTYKLKTNRKGIAMFLIPKNLKKGTYKIKTSYNGLTNINKIKVKK